MGKIKPTVEPGPPGTEGLLVQFKGSLQTPGKFTAQSPSTAEAERMLLTEATAASTNDTTAFLDVLFPSAMRESS
jgi:hypothetical protein